MKHDETECIDFSFYFKRDAVCELQDRLENEIVSKFQIGSRALIFWNLCEAES